MQNQIPLWIVASLGKTVELVFRFRGAVQTYEPGYQGILHGIHVGESGRCVLTVALDEEDPSYLENFYFDQVRPAQDRIEFSLDLEQGAIAF